MRGDYLPVLDGLRIRGGAKLANFAALVTALAAVISALIWPALIAGIMIGFRRPIRLILEKVPTFLDRTEKAKLGIVEFELSKQAKEASNKPESERGRSRLSRFGRPPRLSMPRDPFPSAT